MVQEKLEEILRLVADSEKITNYEINPHRDALKGDGFLSECFTGEVKNKDTGSRIETYVKISPPYLPQLISAAYSNECRFYSEIFPEFNKFQIEKGVKHPFTNIPKFYCGDYKEDIKYVAMENLQFQKYDMVDKSQNLSREHLKLIFEIYGRFHALSFTFKDQNFEKYSELTKPLYDIFIPVSEKIDYHFTKAFNALKEINMDIYKKVEPVNENLNEIFRKSAQYNGKYSGLTHGDCWSNNTLFKYQENGQIEDIKLIDFQLCRNSTPIHDLSYFFYSGASKEDFSKLEDYLEVYHKSFSAFAKELGGDPEKLLPLDTLKLEWKKYSLLGICMAIMLWQHKLTNKEKIVELVSNGPLDEEEYKNGVLSVYQTEAYKKNTSDILIHAVEYGII